MIQSDAEKLRFLWRSKDVKSLCKLFFNVNLTKNQEVIVKNIVFNESKRIVISCMTRYGKSWSVSLGILLWILRNKGKKVVIVAPTNEKTTIIRNYIANFTSYSPVFSNLIDIDKTGVERIRKEVSKRRITWKNGVEMRTLSAEGKGEQLMGFGADLVVVDEICDIDLEVYHSKILRMLGDSNDSCFVGIGNPWHKNSPMWEEWINPNWLKIQIGFDIALKEGRITEDFINEQKQVLTEQEFQILYKAEFPEEEPDSLISWSWVNNAIGKKFDVFEEFEVFAGVDVAEQGNDLTVVTIGRKNLKTNDYVIDCIESWGKIDLMPTVARILPLISQYNVQKIRVDATGVGSGVYSRLEEIRREGKIKCKVESFKGGLTPSTDEFKQRFLNLKAEAYWHLRRLFEEGKISIPKHNVLIEQLTKMKWELTSSEKIRIMSPGQKEGDTAIEKSPDFSDSLNISVFYDVKTPMSFFALNFNKVK